MVGMMVAAFKMDREATRIKNRGIAIDREGGTMDQLGRCHYGRCLLHIMAVFLGAWHGHAHVSFHARGIARELTEYMR